MYASRSASSGAVSSVLYDGIRGPPFMMKVPTFWSVTGCPVIIVAFLKRPSRGGAFPGFEAIVYSL
jgi:hypothetical protein